MEEVRREVEALEEMGHRRLLVLTGESPKYTFDRFLEALKVIAVSGLSPKYTFDRFLLMSSVPPSRLLFPSPVASLPPSAAACPT